jgi:hypothetical protein
MVYGSLDEVMDKWVTIICRRSPLKCETSNKVRGKLAGETDRVVIVHGAFFHPYDVRKKTYSTLQIDRDDIKAISTYKKV